MAHEAHEGLSKLVFHEFSALKVESNVMADHDDIVLSCAKWQEIPGAWNRLKSVLPPDIKKRMSEIMLNYFANFGPEGLFERMNNRTIAQIIDEFQPGQARPVASGEVGDVRWNLYRKPTSGQGEDAGK
jgi:hypothetical protein